VCPFARPAIGAGRAALDDRQRLVIFLILIERAPNQVVFVVVRPPQTRTLIRTSRELSLTSLPAALANTQTGRNIFRVPFHAPSRPPRNPRGFSALAMARRQSQIETG
jgi:hypothetical protein